MPERRVINGYIVERRDDGTIVTIGRADQPAQPPVDPTFQVNQATVQPQIQRSQAEATNAAVEANINAATQGAQIAQVAASAEQIRLENEKLKAELAAGGVSADRRAELQDRIGRLNSLIEQVNRVQELFDNSVGQTSGLRGIQDYLPTDANARFDAAGASLSQQGLGAFRVPGTGNVSDRDAAMFDRANLPTAATRDSAIDEQLRGIRSRVNEEFRTLGLPAPEWRQTTLNRFKDDMGAVARETIPPNVWNQIRTGQAPALTAAPAGSTMRIVPVPPEMAQAHAELVTRLATQGGGRIDPAAYAQARAALDRQFGMEPGDGYEDWAASVNSYLEAGGRTLPTGITPNEVPMTQYEQAQNNIANSQIGAGIANAADMGGLGFVSLLAPDQMAAINEANPEGALAGQIVGGITGAGLTGALARQTIGRAAPRLLGGGAKGLFGRNLAADTAYSGIYGANTGQNPLETAAMGAVGSGLGQGLSTIAGASLRGVRPSQAVEYLSGRNIPLTGGQTIGGLASRAEERAMSIPFIGDMIRNRRLEGIEAFNRAAFEDAGAPISARVGEVGKEGLEALGDQVSSAYDSATQGVDIPLDQQFLADMQQVVANASQRLPRPEARRLGQVLDARVQPIADMGRITGETFQQASRGLKGARNSTPTQFQGFEEYYRDALTGANDALTNQMIRGGGDSVVTGLNAANAANRNLRTLENAANTAAGGSATDMPFVFTPNQLQRAGLQTQKKYPGPRPFEQLADFGQEVLPNRIPNSGTADRVAQMALPGLAVGGAGVGYGIGDGEGAATGATLGSLPTIAALLAAIGGTKRGQQLITGAITRRPEELRKLGEATLRRRGLFGSAVAAPAITAY